MLYFVLPMRLIIYIASFIRLITLFGEERASFLVVWITIFSVNLFGKVSPSC